MKYPQEKPGIHLNHVEGVTLLVLFLFCKLTKMHGRILHLFLRGEGRKGSSGKYLEKNVPGAERDAPVISTLPHVCFCMH